MDRRRDSMGIGGDGASSQHETAPASLTGPKRPFLSVWFRCCHVYGRMYRDAEGTRYDGRCPKCGAAVQAIIGSDGTSRRMFEAR